VNRLVIGKVKFMVTYQEQRKGREAALVVVVIIGASFSSSSVAVAAAVFLFLFLPPLWFVK